MNILIMISIIAITLMITMLIYLLVYLRKSIELRNLEIREKYNNLNRK